MNLKTAKRLRQIARMMDCQSIQTVHTYSKKRGQGNCIVVWSLCQRGNYLSLKRWENESRARHNRLHA
jgi:hypothetical protein